MSDRPPPPFVPPVPVADGGGGQRGTSRRWVVLGGGSLVAMIVLVALLAGGDDGGGSDDPDGRPASGVVEGTGSSVPGFTDADEGFADGGDIEELLSDVSASEERCLREKIAEGVEEGSFTETQAMGEVLGYLEECGIPPEELLGEPGP